ncbi:von Willebrand factor D and EGF domain-containing protein isoform X2 [Magallana gigas]|uniref:von Willebrand factor D and EGF domain-containing protein isoform X2 n=1 Tax=Magallana gigas TaxID=29159 RepID=UPI00333EC0BF
MERAKIHSRRKRMFSWLGFCLLFVVIKAQNPCLDGNYYEIDHVTKRSPSFDMDSTPICDRYITEGWYRAKSHVMSTSPPILGKCNTLYPVWLKDPTPPDGDTETLTACEVGFFDDCSNTYEIDVKNCSTFLVYKLIPLDVCNAAYCFELGHDCVDEFVDNVRVSFHNITWTEKKHAIVPGLFQYDPSVNLICSFTPSDDDSLLYHIDWYVDNETVIQGQTVDKWSLDDAIFSAADLNKAGKKINTWIRCAVGVKKSKNSLPCFSKSSKLFFAGIEILNHTLSIERKGKVTLMMRPTIPFASETIHTPDGKQSASPLNIQLSFPGKSEAKCKRSSIGNLKKCSVTIDSHIFREKQNYEDETKWYKIHTIEIFNSDDEGYYMPDHKLVLRLETNSPSGQGAMIFSDVVFHDVHINVVDEKEAWKGKRCSSYADPHQTTFDGLHYECQSTGCITGKTYIFYKNAAHLQEVQVRHENCWGRPRCVCAVAARSGQDVFTIDACYRRQYINFPICKENSLKVIKETDKVYKIIFPTGTFVKVFLYNYGWSFWYINLEVYPTVADLGKTSGLCGVLDNDRTNDLRRMDGTQDNIYSYSYHNPPDGFSLSWQLPAGSSDDLLADSQTVFDSLTPLSSYLHKLCTCDKDKTLCSYKQYTECKTNVRGREYHCVLHSSSSMRKKRDLEILTSLQEMDAKSVKQTRVKRQAVSEVDAFNICDDAFQQSAHYNICLQVVPNFTNETFANCINDLTITGDHNLTQLHLDTGLVQCQTYILLNSTFANEHPDIAAFITSLCPNNCSSNGICTSGNCTCNDGYGGSDCSFDVLSPPTITRLSGDGVCDKSSASCDDITLYGNYFLENMRTSCFVTREENNENNTVALSTSYNTKLEERTMFEGYCSLEYGSGNSWITSFQFNLSNDGTQFTDLHTVFIYQSACQTFNNESGSVYFTLQNGFCYINGTCIERGTSKSNESCWQCLPLFNTFDWTWECNTTETTETTEPTTTSFHPASSTSSADLTTTSVHPASSTSSADLTSTTVLMASSETDQTSRTTKKYKNRHEDTKEVLQLEVIGLSIAVAVFAIMILLVTGYMVKQKLLSKTSMNKLKPTTEDTCRDSKTTIITGISNPDVLWLFQRSDQLYSRPPSSTFLYEMPPTNDLRRLYEKPAAQPVQFFVKQQYFHGN